MLLRALKSPQKFRTSSSASFLGYWHISGLKSKSYYEIWTFWSQIDLQMIQFHSFLDVKWDFLFSLLKKSLWNPGKPINWVIIMVQVFFHTFLQLVKTHPLKISLNVNSSCKIIQKLFIVPIKIEVIVKLLFCKEWFFWPNFLHLEKQSVKIGKQLTSSKEIEVS